MIIFHPSADGVGEEVYNDGVVRAAEITPDLFVLEAAGRSVQFDLMSIDGAANQLAREAKGCLRSIIEGSRALLDHVAEGLPVDG